MLTRHLTLVAVLALSVTPVAMAQSYPAKPIRFIVPWSAGSGTDMMARAFARSRSLWSVVSVSCVGSIIPTRVLAANSFKPSVASSSWSHSGSCPTSFRY